MLLVIHRGDGFRIESMTLIYGIPAHKISPIKYAGNDSDSPKNGFCLKSSPLHESSAKYSQGGKHNVSVLCFAYRSWDSLWRSLLFCFLIALLMDGICYLVSYLRLLSIPFF
ncbi:hypothetical protein K440DRAFT_185243 [Wilcoxina mikolae CBS 423.85]|nr:hypothetical protein K440DRAFT_185243 [Wilcoxina mikolae CBS 423.85]